MAQLKVAVTGASGFIGSELCRHLQNVGHTPIAIATTAPTPNIPSRKIKDITNELEIANAIFDCDAVVHLAASNNESPKISKTKCNEIRVINVFFTEALAKATIRLEIPRFIFLSTIKVHGEKTRGTPFKIDDEPRPKSIYGITKLEAEMTLQKLARSNRFRPVIIRSPLVHGGDPQGNLATILKFASRGIPLPFLSIKNYRSTISRSLICDLLDTCLTHTNAPGHTFLVSDGITRSTPEIIGLICNQNGLDAKLFYCPKWLIALSAILLGKTNLMSKLLDDLEVDIDYTVNTLGWDPTNRNSKLKIEPVNSNLNALRHEKL